MAHASPTRALVYIVVRTRNLFFHHPPPSKRVRATLAIDCQRHPPREKNAGGVKDWPPRRRSTHARASPTGRKIRLNERAIRRRTAPRGGAILLALAASVVVAFRMREKWPWRRIMAGAALLCLLLVGTLFFTKTEGPIGARVTQVMEGKVVNEIKQDAAVSSAKIQLTWNEWVRGDEHAQTIRSMESLISAYRRSGDLEEAESLAQILLARKMATVGPNHWETLNAHADLGFILYRLKDYPSAEKHFRQALEGRLRNLGEAHWDTANAASMLSHAIDRQQTNPEQALVFADMALRGFRGDQNPNIPLSIRQDIEQRTLDHIRSINERAKPEPTSTPIR